MHTNIELKIVCKSEIRGLQLFLKFIITVLLSNVLSQNVPDLWAAILNALSPSVFFDRAL